MSLYKRLHEQQGSNGSAPAVNGAALVYLVIIVVAALAAIPLMILSGAGA